MKRKPAGIEFTYRVMYLVFLLYAAVVIGAGVTSVVSMVGLLLFGGGGLEAWVSGMCYIGLLWMLVHVRDFWAKHFDLYRMDDNFSGVCYLERHLDHPEWSRVCGLLEQLHSSTGGMEREAMRREICALVRQKQDLYEAVYELGDDRLRWSLENVR